MTILKDGIWVKVLQMWQEEYHESTMLSVDCHDMLFNSTVRCSVQYYSQDCLMYASNIAQNHWKWGKNISMQNCHPSSSACILKGKWTCHGTVWQHLRCWLWIKETVTLSAAKIKPEQGLSLAVSDASFAWALHEVYSFCFLPHYWLNLEPLYIIRLWTILSVKCVHF